MKGDRHDTIQDIQRECTAVSNATVFENFSIDSSYVLIQKETSELLRNGELECV
jgi:hypothetical protein